MSYLTDRALATGVTLQDLIHIVIPTDISQNPDGSSYKATIQQVKDALELPTTYWTSGSTGNYSIKAINDSSVDATGLRAVAWGNNSLASGDNSTASGYQTQATGSTSTAEGYETIAGGSRGHAEGYQSRAMGTNSHAEGNASEANGNTSHAEGWVCIANGDFSHAEGWITRADGNRSHSQGYLTIASGNKSHAGGDTSIASGETSFIHSTNSLVTGARSVLLGGQNLTGTTDDTVYVPYLNINNLGLGTPINNLGIDSNGFVVTGTTTIDTDTFVTGGTYSAGTATFTNNTGGTFNVTGFTQPFTGNTSGDCINDIYVKKIHSCSPLNINPLDEGNVYFGSTSAITIDLSNNRVGIGTSTPQYPLQIVGTNSTFYYDPVSSGGRFNISGNTNIPRYDVSISPYLTRPVTGGAFGMRAWNDTLWPGYGKVGDMFIYAGNETNGLNLINGPGTNTDDYIRFYAGKTAASTADIHIQGSGSTKGYVGIGTETPTEKLDVNGKTKTTNFQMTSGPTNGYVLTSDASGNATWQTLPSAVNIYNADGSLTATRTLNLNGQTLFVLGANGQVQFSNGNQLFVEGTGANQPSVILNAPNNIKRNLQFRTAGINRWELTTDGNETGSEQGTNLILNAYDDAGSLIGTFLRIRRVDGAITFNEEFTFPTSDGLAGQVLQTNGSGLVQWVTPTAGVSIDPYYTEPSTLSITWNVSGNSTNYQTVLTGNTTLNLSNVRNGDYGTIIVQQDGVGSRTMTFGTVNGAGSTHRVVNGGGGTPTLTSNPNAIDILTFTYNGAAMYWTVGNDYT